MSHGYADEHADRVHAQGPGSQGRGDRLRNEAKRKRSFAESAWTHTKAEANTLMAASYEAGRALDTTLGTAVTARDAVVDTVKPLGGPPKAISRVRAEAAGTLERFERKGVQTRSQAQRRIERLGRQTKQQAEEKSLA